MFGTPRTAGLHPREDSRRHSSVPLPPPSPRFLLLTVRTHSLECPSGALGLAVLAVPLQPTRWWGVWGAERPRLCTHRPAVTRAAPGQQPRAQHEPRPAPGQLLWGERALPQPKRRPRWVSVSGGVRPPLAGSGRTTVRAVTGSSLYESKYRPLLVFSLPSLSVVCSRGRHLPVFPHKVLSSLTTLCPLGFRAWAEAVGAVLDLGCLSGMW